MLGIATLHTMFADNLSLLLKRPLYVSPCHWILQLFGVVSWLQCVWEPEDPPPMDFYLGNGKTPSTPLSSWAFQLLLNSHFSLMETQVMAKLDTLFAKVNGQQLALAAHVIVTNGWILSSLWYIITLWAGTSTSSVSYNTRYKPLFGPGGLGWIRTQSVNVNPKEG